MNSPGKTLRFAALDGWRGLALLWMTVFHFFFDLNHFGFIQTDFYNAPVWTLQRTCILSLFLACAGFSQAIALQHQQTEARFWKRWAQIAGCAVLVSAGSYAMFADRWIYFGVLHAIALMLIIVRFTARWGSWLWLAGLVALVLGISAPELHNRWPGLEVLNSKWPGILGLVSRKPATEDYVPLLPWLCAMWWGMACGQWVASKHMAALKTAGHWTPKHLAWLGQHALVWYMLHQPVLMGLLWLIRQSQTGFDHLF